MKLQKIGENITVMTADEGFLFVPADADSGMYPTATIYLGSKDSPDNYREIPAAEAANFNLMSEPDNISDDEQQPAQ